MDSVTDQQISAFVQRAGGRRQRVQAAMPDRQQLASRADLCLKEKWCWGEVYGTTVQAIAKKP